MQRQKRRRRRSPSSSSESSSSTSDSWDTSTSDSSETSNSSDSSPDRKGKKGSLREEKRRYEQRRKIWKVQLRTTEEVTHHKKPGPCTNWLGLRKYIKQKGHNEPIYVGWHRRDNKLILHVSKNRDSNMFARQYGRVNVKEMDEEEIKEMLRMYGEPQAQPLRHVTTGDENSRAILKHSRRVNSETRGKRKASEPSTSPGNRRNEDELTLSSQEGKSDGQSTVPDGKIVQQTMAGGIVVTKKNKRRRWRNAARKLQKEAGKHNCGELLHCLQMYWHDKAVHHDEPGECTEYKGLRAYVQEKKLLAIGWHGDELHVEERQFVGTTGTINNCSTCIDAILGRYGEPQSGRARRSGAQARQQRGRGLNAAPDAAPDAAQAAQNQPPAQQVQQQVIVAQPAQQQALAQAQVQGVQVIEKVADLKTELKLQMEWLRKDVKTLTNGIEADMATVIAMEKICRAVDNEEVPPRHAWQMIRALEAKVTDHLINVQIPAKEQFRKTMEDTIVHVWPPKMGYGRSATWLKRLKTIHKVRKTVGIKGVKVRVEMAAAMLKIPKSDTDNLLREIVMLNQGRMVTRFLEQAMMTEADEPELVDLLRAAAVDDNQSEYKEKPDNTQLKRKCLNYERGNCTYVNCKFVHGTGEKSAVTASRNVENRGICRDWARGKCTRGKRCRFQHDDRPYRRDRSRSPPRRYGRSPARRFGSPRHDNNNGNREGGRRGRSPRARSPPRTGRRHRHEDRPVQDEVRPQHREWDEKRNSLTHTERGSFTLKVVRTEKEVHVPSIFVYTGNTKRAVFLDSMCIGCPGAVDPFTAAELVAGNEGTKIKVHMKANTGNGVVDVDEAVKCELK